MKWISVKDKMPENQRVLTVAQVYKETDPMRYRILDAQFVKIAKDVEYWMPLPDPPK